jgi:hypothetical protein
MPIIKPRGLLKGDRMARLSDHGRLYWPFLYAGSNGYGRFRVNYQTILTSCFESFLEKPSRNLIRQILREYRTHHLLFFYKTDSGQTWAAWDSAVKQNYYTKEDESSPAPPEPDFSDWLSAYHRPKTSVSDPADDSLADEVLLPDTVENSADSTQFGSFDIKTKELVSKRALSQSDTTNNNTTQQQSSFSSRKATTNNVSPPRIPEAGLELWAHAVYYRHPKKADKHDAITLLLKLGKDPVLRKLIDRNHELWCKVHNWRKEQGRYAPKLFQWLDDEGYTSAPDLEEQPPEKRGIPAGAIE